MGVMWDPWIGCTKISLGCFHCYMFREYCIANGKEEDHSLKSIKCIKTEEFDFPVRKKDGQYILPLNSFVDASFHSDFFINEADEWRNAAWKMIKERNDCRFTFYTKRIDRFMDCIPKDWNKGYDNVHIGCSVENQTAADYRLPLFLSFPILHRRICIEPILGPINLRNYLHDGIEYVSVSGESGLNARPCHYEWVKDIYHQCVENNVVFSFRQTGKNYYKNNEHFCYENREEQIHIARTTKFE